MDIVRQRLDGGNGNDADFRVRQLRARQMLRGELEGEDLERYVEERVLLTTLEKAQNWARDLANASLLRRIYTRRPVYEQMVDFWSNHLNVTTPGGDVSEMRPAEDRDVIRRHALGRFSDMLRASATRSWISRRATRSLITSCWSSTARRASENPVALSWRKAPGVWGRPWAFTLASRSTIAWSCSRNQRSILQLS